MSKVLFLVVLVISLFFIGFISYPIAESMFSENLNIPLSFSETKELNSPSDWIKEDQIVLSDEDIILNINGAAIAKFANTNSMDPILDEDSSGIEVRPKYPQQIHKGDIVVYNKGEDKNIIHRVIDMGSDELGIYYLMKGDNNDVIDPIKIRFSDIKYVLVGILY